MTDDERLERLLREALRRTTVVGLSRDLWPRIVERSRAPAAWCWLDFGIAVLVAIVVLMHPRWLWLLVHHL